MTLGKKVQRIMDEIESVYKVKSKGPLDYYLDNDYKLDKKTQLCFGSKKYIKEVLT